MSNNTDKTTALITQIVVIMIKAASLRVKNIKHYYYYIILEWTHLNRNSFVADAFEDKIAEFINNARNEKCWRRTPLNSNVASCHADKIMSSLGKLINLLYAEVTFIFHEGWMRKLNKRASPFFEGLCYRLERVHVRYWILCVGCCRGGVGYYATHQMLLHLRLKKWKKKKMSNPKVWAPDWKIILIIHVQSRIWTLLSKKWQHMMYW